jgi:hypothetical protein
MRPSSTFLLAVLAFLFACQPAALIKLIEQSVLAPLSAGKQLLPRLRTVDPEDVLKGSVHGFYIAHKWLLAILVCVILAGIFSYELYHLVDDLHRVAKVFLALK